MRFDYFVGVLAEKNGYALETRYYSNDESQAFNFFNHCTEYYSKHALRVIVLKKWSNDDYHQIKIVTH